MPKRKIITIDEEKCNGCGNCVTGCSEGALQIVDGGAKLVNEKYCDGFGDCIGECPTGALKIEEKESEEFDRQATLKHVKRTRGKKGVQEMIAAQQEHQTDNSPASGCPGMKMQVLNQTKTRKQETTSKQNITSRQNTTSKQKNTDDTRRKPQLSQWPIQIQLLPPKAPFFENANLLITADCVPAAYADFQELLGGKTMAMGCPKLDDAGHYVQKLTEIIKNNSLQSITVVRMEVPCCGGLVKIAEQALKKANSSLELEVINISVKGKKLSQ